MPRLNLSDPRLQQVPPTFMSRWPSLDSWLDPKVSSMLNSDFGAMEAVQSACESGWDAFRLVLRDKAVIVGDFLTSQLNDSAWFEKVTGGLQELKGVFSNVSWRLITDVKNGRLGLAQAGQALALAAVPTAIKAITAVPLAGQLAESYFAAGLKLAEMYDDAIKGRALLMPWSQYSKNTDEDLVNKGLVNRYAMQVDQTNVFRPPWENPSTPWRLGIGGNADNPKGFVWAPLIDGEIPFSADYIGGLPGTMRIFGQTQVTRPGPAPDPALDRLVRRPIGFNPRGVALPWPPTVVNCGDFYPAASQTCGVMWNMYEKAGLPDMFKVHVPTLLDAWGMAFDAMLSSFTELWNNPNSFMYSILAATHAEARRTLGAAMEPWIAMRRRKTAGRVFQWELGLPWRIPSGFAIVTPDMFAGGLPGDPNGRTPSLWIEENLSKKTRGWPYRALTDRLPKQHPCAEWKACSSDLAATIDAERVTHPAAWKNPAGPAPPGYRKVPWPPPEVDAHEYASPYDAIIKPALERLRKQQLASLKATLVCAYIRPTEVSGLARYGAFKEGDDLQKLALEVREVLLKHPLRFRVNLADVDAIDPAFAQRLRDSGVTGGPGDFSKSLGFKASAPVVDGAEPPPPGQEPQGGVPFGREIEGSSSGAPGAIALAALAAIAFKFAR